MEDSSMEACPTEGFKGFVFRTVSKVFLLQFHVHRDCISLLAYVNSPLKAVYFRTPSSYATNYAS